MSLLYFNEEIYLNIVQKTNKNSVSIMISFDAV